jgi:hypothetical protein
VDSRSYDVPVGDFDGLSPYDFELLVADLLRCELGRPFETFAKGPDGGVDIRARLTDGYHYVQCKHYTNSTLSHLRQAAVSERERFGAKSQRPVHYTFVTSRRLTAANKAELEGILGDLMTGEPGVLGAADLAALLRRHPDVARAHVKLWLRGSTHLKRAVDADIFARSEALLDESRASLSRYVLTDNFRQARERLTDYHVVVVTGPPGIGKTTLAQVLLLDAADQGFQPYCVQADIGEAWRLLARDQPQVFFFDDFLGRTALFEGVSEDVRDLGAFIRCARRSPNTRLILSTRPYILRQAHQRIEQLHWQWLALPEFTLSLTQYTRLERAHIFYNHLYFAEALPPSALQSLLRDRRYLRVIDHKNYSPRLIEWITGFGGEAGVDLANGDFATYCLDVLDHPQDLWKHAYTTGLDDYARSVLLLLPGLAANVDLADLEAAYRPAVRVRKLSESRERFDGALRVLQDSFLHIRFAAGKQTTISVLNPSLIDFLRTQLEDDPQELRTALAGASYFEQVQHLIEIALHVGSDLEELASIGVDAVNRTLLEPSPSGRVLATAQGVRLATRVATVLQWCKEAPTLRGLATVITSKAALMATNVGQASRDELRDYAALLGDLATLDLDALSLVEAIKRHAIGCLNSSDAYETLGIVDRYYPASFTRDERDTLRVQLVTWLEFMLRRPGPFDMYEIDRLEYIATAFGATFDYALFEDARALVMTEAPAHTKQWEAAIDEYQPSANPLYQALNEARSRDSPIVPVTSHIDALFMTLGT